MRTRVGMDLTVLMCILALSCAHASDPAAPPPPPAAPEILSLGAHVQCDSPPARCEDVVAALTAVGWTNLVDDEDSADISLQFRRDELRLQQLRGPSLQAIVIAGPKESPSFANSLKGFAKSIWGDASKSDRSEWLSRDAIDSLVRRAMESDELKLFARARVRERDAAEAVRSREAEASMAREVEARETRERTLLIIQERRSAQIEALGLGKAYLDATMHLPLDLMNPPQPTMSMRRWLALVIENKDVVRVTAVEAAKLRGVSVKRRGAETMGFLFRLDDGDLFLTHVIRRDRMIPLDVPEDAVGASLVVLKLAVDAIPDTPG